MIWIAIAAAFISALVLTKPAIAAANKFHIVDLPNKRKIHSKPTPRIGGVAIYLAFVIGTLLLGEYTRQVAAILVAGSIVFFTGLIDDIKDISPKLKLLGQIIAALVLVYSGMSVRFFTNPFDGSIISFGFLSVPITVIWLVGISNAVNLIDGMDGLSAGVSAIAAIATVIVCASQGEITSAALAGVLVASALGFLPWNFNPAKTFMGDCGALFLGFILGALSLMGLSKGATAISIFIPFIILGVPVLDTFCAIVRRIFLRKPIFEADKMHLHQTLLSLGLTQRQTVLIIYVIALVMGLCAVMMAVLTTAQATLVLIITVLLTFGGAEYLGVLRGKRHFSLTDKADKKQGATD